MNADPCSDEPDECMDDGEILGTSQYQLLRHIRENSNEIEGMKKYLTKLRSDKITDFPEGLEWFNVSEPLSFSHHLKGKIVLLDFFTYCCINCMHIIPDLRSIEEDFSVEDGLVVIGVHSAKFDNEKISSNILSAVQRYNITHPVVNDHNSFMWKNCHVYCWPSLLLLGPDAKPIVLLTGEGNKGTLQVSIKGALAYFREKNQISNHSLPFKSAYHLLPDLKGPLLFPGKITTFKDAKGKELIAISDSGNHRILIVSSDGMILNQIGCGKVGFKDGTFKSAEFNSPQGLVFQDDNTLFIADTENHAIRKIDLKKQTVETVAGTGVQGNDKFGGKQGKLQSISSPWDLCIYRGPDMDLSGPHNDVPLKTVLIIAMAGTHQIWALFFEDTVWWKKKKISAGTCICIAGSGKEENRNNSYPQAAGFAQPSGIALCNKYQDVYIADSESSSVRRFSLLNGKVSAVVGGATNPQHLFAFGDKDGTLFDAKLQHALGVAISPDESTLFVADTYNHKVKKVDIFKNTVTTLSHSPSDATDGQSFTFNEPAGLCVSIDGNKLYLADTNNHIIKVLHLNGDKTIQSISNLNLYLPENNLKTDNSKLPVYECKAVDVDENGGKIIFNINVIFKEGLKLTEDAPQTWSIDLPNATWACVPSSGNDSNVDVVMSVPRNIQSNVDFIFNFVTCTDDTCFPKNFIVRLPVHSKAKNATNVKTCASIALSPKSIDIIN